MHPKYCKHMCMYHTVILHYWALYSLPCNAFPKASACRQLGSSLSVLGFTVTFMSC